ncbi:HET-domain-containing protein [Hypoxylon sp. FL0543]|nr:HET-domain-containing protein [Hypoxylon sp. FL0543]
MRLLNARTKKLSEFLEADAPPYAILSHTWGAAEVSFDDIQSAWPKYRLKEGWKKIKWCCRQALKDDLEYVWVDTCCIDKSSSAELQEAINSMFRWYERSHVCYAYLADVGSGTESQDFDFFWRLRGSRWFTRGWTLQELIAPGLLIFFDASWKKLGTRYALREDISSITGISQVVLEGAAISARRALRSASIAQKMSWAAGRSTSRPEDMAYCLLGIFQVNMPMLYGEGNEAFTRLQEQIIRSSDDQTILAWGFKRPILKLWGASHALATSPSDFAECSDLIYWGAAEPGDSFALTQRGLALHLPTVDLYGNNTMIYCLLNCAVADPDAGGAIRVLALPLLQVSSLYKWPLTGSAPLTEDVYTRLTLWTPLWIPADHLRTQPRKTIYLPKVRVYEQPATQLSQLKRVNMRVNSIGLPAPYCIAGIWPPAIVSNDLLQYTCEQLALGMCIMVHVARPHLPGFILVIRYSYRMPQRSDQPTFQPSGNTEHDSLKIGSCMPGTNNDYIINMVRTITAQILDLSVADLQEDSNLAELGMDSLASLEMVHLLRKVMRLPIYSDILLDCVTLRDVERKIILHFRAAPIMNSLPEKEDGVTNRWTFQTGIENVKFALAEVHADASLLDNVVDSAVSRKTWKRMIYWTPRRVKGGPVGEYHYIADLKFGSHATVKVNLKAGEALSELRLWWGDDEVEAWSDSS